MGLANSAETGEQFYNDTSTAFNGDTLEHTKSELKSLGWRFFHFLYLCHENPF